MTVIHTPQARPMRGMIIFVVALVLFIMFLRVIGLITDWFWFQEVGYQTIFTVTLLAKLKTGALFGACFFIILAGNLLIALRLSRIPLFGDQAGAGAFGIPHRELEPGALKILILMGSLLVGLFAAANGSAQWENLLLFLNPTPFGVSDPLFRKDIGFYVFQFPFLLHIYGWLKFAIVLTAAAAMLGAFFILDDPIFNGLAVALIFGILVSTVLTLLVIPLLYFSYIRRTRAAARAR